MRKFHAELKELKEIAKLYKLISKDRSIIPKMVKLCDNNDTAEAKYFAARAYAFIGEFDLARHYFDLSFHRGMRHAGYKAAAMVEEQEGRRNEKLISYYNHEISKRDDWREPEDLYNLLME